MIEPGFLALTTTPSIGPSCAELTTPVSAGSPCANARCEVEHRGRTAAAAVRLPTSLCRIVFSLGQTLFGRSLFLLAAKTAAGADRLNRRARIDGCDSLPLPGDGDKPHSARC